MTFCQMHKKDGGCPECPNRWVCINSTLEKDRSQRPDKNDQLHYTTKEA